jgi:pimeloyl-ACP methyl ester carboxylesterase
MARHTHQRLAISSKDARRFAMRTVAAALMVLAVLPGGGCATNKTTLRSVPKSPLAEELDLASFSGPKTSERTTQLLRVYDLSGDLNGDFKPLLKKLQAINDREPAAETVYAVSEVAFLGGKKVEHSDKQAALNYYGAAVLHAYQYLFDPRFMPTRNPYDPQYRGACELYNGALESALRIICANKELVPNNTKTLHTAAGDLDITCKLQSGWWQPEDFERFEFVSDYEMRGLTNHYQTHGLGVPLIAIRHSHPHDEPACAKYYSPGLSFPVTAFLRPVAKGEAADGNVFGRNQCVLELYDTLAADETQVAGVRVPLESDLTTPLGFFLSQPEMDMQNLLATAGLLRPDLVIKQLRPGPNGQQTSIMGLYMAQPYEPGKIPVLMVHGLWSTPMTWMEMFNDLRSQKAIRDHYQFWFYLYPTSQPFWQSAARLRRDLAQLRETLDPQHQEPSLDQMVLIGHSMGGLVAQLQTIQSHDDYWKLASTEPFGQIKADDKTRAKLQNVFYFEANPSIRRVVTIATPHRGSTFSDQTTQWLLDRIIRLPTQIAEGQQKLYRENPKAFSTNSLLRIDTSIDSLSPNEPIFPVMVAAQRPPWVTYNSIVGVMPKDWWMAKLSSEDGDGVVSRASAHFDGAESEIIVPAYHASVQAHPAAVLEVRRILLEHLAQMQGEASGSIANRLKPADVMQR